MALALILAAVLSMAPGLLRLELRTDGHALVPPDDPAIALDREARQAFGLRDPLLVVIETRHPDGIFNPGTLNSLERLTRELAAVPGLDAGHIQSLATERSPRFKPGRSSFQGLLEPPATTPERLAELREDVDSIDILHGTLVSYDRRAAAVLIGVPDSSDRTELYHRVSETARRYETGGDRVSVVGPPAAEALLGEHILSDLAVMVPLALVIIGAVLWIACGRAWAALLGLAKVGAAQVFTLGLMGWCNEPVYLTTAMIPVLLTTVGLADEIHLLWHYRHRPVDEPSSEGLRHILGELARPVALTSLTTAVGFLSFLTSNIQPVSRFGLFTAIGVLFCMVWSLVATPALLSLRPEAIPAAGPAARTLRGARLALLLGSRPRVALAALAFGTLLLALGIPRLFVQDSWIDNFSKDSPLRQATERVDRDFAGTHVLQVVVTFDPPPDQIPVIPAASGPLLSGSAVAALGRFEEGLRARPEVGGVFGLASHLSTTAFLWGGRREETRVIVDNPSWIYLHVRRIGNVRGQERRTELVDDGFRRTVVTVLLEGANFRRTAAVIDEVRRLERQVLAPAHARADLAGDLAVSQAMIPAIVRTQTGSLLGALAANLLILSLLLRSFRLGIACAIPTTVAVAWTFGLMGWLGIPLGVATSVFCAVTLGIGDDYSIHFLKRFQAARAAGAVHPARVAAAEAGPAILIDTLAVSLGFGLLALSRVPTNGWLGLLVV
ncbi:MAG TPA: MMPL family transporter, partial [Thermoanaerobaculia bacterium]|nr:MMPL family transporter [Thermoanaerobaculia bacterium]